MWCKLASALSRRLHHIDAAWSRNRCADMPPLGGVHAGAAPLTAAHTPEKRQTTSKEPWYSHFTGKINQSLIPLSVDPCKTRLVPEYHGTRTCTIAYHGTKYRGSKGGQLNR